MFVQLLRSWPPTRRFVFWLGAGRGKTFADLVEPYIKKKDAVLDIGTGTGNVCLVLKERGYNALPLDVEDLSFSPLIVPELYDGTRMPYKDHVYDVGLLLTVLHHTPCPEDIVVEAARVARRVIIIEDIYNNRFEQYMTYVFDSLLNLEFVGHPHSNKNDAQWQAFFAAKGYRLTKVAHARTFGIFRHAIYVLDVA